MTHRIVDGPALIPGVGGKVIEELFGRVNTGTSAFSLAHMVSPPGWSEPFQTPEFTEVTVMVRGTMRIEVGDEVVELCAGRAIQVEPGVRVRYSNPYDVDNEYYALCMPAFSPETVHRDDAPEQ